MSTGLEIEVSGLQGHSMRRGLGKTEGKRQERGRGLIVRLRNLRLEHYDLMLQAMGATDAG